MLKDNNNNVLHEQRVVLRAPQSADSFIFNLRSCSRLSYENVKAHISLVIIWRWFTVYAPSSNLIARRVRLPFSHWLSPSHRIRFYCIALVFLPEHYYIIHSLKVDIHLITYSRMRTLCALIVSQIKLHYHILYFIAHITLCARQEVYLSLSVLIVSPDSSACRENKTNKIVKMTIRLSNADQYVCARVSNKMKATISFFCRYFSGRACVCCVCRRTCTRSRPRLAPRANLSASTTI